MEPLKIVMSSEQIKANWEGLKHYTTYESAQELIEASEKDKVFVGGCYLIVSDQLFLPETGWAC